MKLGAHVWIIEQVHVHHKQCSSRVLPSVRAAPEAHSSVTSPRIPLIRPERQIDL